MQYKQLGQSNIRVSQLGLGSMTWGSGNNKVAAFAQLDMAVAAGVTLIDTAEAYPAPSTAEKYGLTETIIGDWLQHRGGRQGLIIASKAAGKGVPWIRNGQGFGGSMLKEALEGTLRRLRCDYVDLYQLHWPERRVPLFNVRNFHANWQHDNDRIYETVAMLAELMRTGKVRAIGLSNETPWATMRYLDEIRKLNLDWPIASLQNCYNLLSRRDEYHLSEVLLREGLGYLAYSPLAGGLLSGKYRNFQRPVGSRFDGWGRKHLTRYLNANVDRAVECYCQLADDYNLDVAEMALAFTYQQGFISSVLVGASSTQQLESALRATQLQLPADVIKKIESIYRKQPDPAS